MPSKQWIECEGCDGLGMRAIDARVYPICLRVGVPLPKFEVQLWRCRMVIAPIHGSHPLAARKEPDVINAEWNDIEIFLSHLHPWRCLYRHCAFVLINIVKEKAAIPSAKRHMVITWVQHQASR